MEQVDLIIHARWVIPVEPAGQTLEHHSVVVNQGRILALFPSEQARQNYKAAQTCELSEHILIPGLINAHGHTAMSLLRGYTDDYPLQIWLEEHIWPAEAQWVSADFVRDGTQLAMAEMIRSGTTCFSDMYFFPEESASVAAKAGMRAQITFPILDFPTAWGEGPDEYIDKGIELLSEYKNSDLVTIGFGPHAPYTVSDEPLKQIAELARELSAPIQIHLHETAFEVESAIEATGQRPSERLMELGLLVSHTQCVHMTQINERDINILQQSNAHVVHCPESNLKLASGFCPIQQLQEAGINVALGTDGAASNNDLDLLGEMRTASLLAKAVSHNASAITAQQALTMATLNGAKALGQEKEIGSLTVGKCADITAIRIDSLEAKPMFNPLSYLVYNNCSHNVSDVWVNGQALMTDRQLQTLDEQALISAAERWAERMQSTPK